MTQSKKTQFSSKTLSLAVAAVIALSACGGPEGGEQSQGGSGSGKPSYGGVELPDVPVGLGSTPAGLQVMPKGWYIHDYPGVCVFLIRDEDGNARACFSYPEELQCKPNVEGGCLRFGVF